MLDRILHHSLIVSIDGESFRPKGKRKFVGTGHPRMLLTLGPSHCGKASVKTR
jgi:hypothetical protein